MTNGVTEGLATLLVKEVCRLLTDVDGAIALGAMRFYGFGYGRSQWRWSDSTLQTFDLKPRSATRIMSPMLDCLVIENGIFATAGYVQYVLLEVAGD